MHNVKRFFQFLYSDGRVVGKNALPKCDQVQILNPDGRCHYCTMPLTGGASTQADHLKAKGNESRQNLTGRQEIAKNVAGEIQTMKFACANCNSEKGDMTDTEFEATEYYRWSREYHAGR